MKRPHSGHLIGFIFIAALALIVLPTGCSPAGKATSKPVISDDGKLTINVQQVYYGKKGATIEESEYSQKLAVTLTKKRAKDSDLLIVPLDVPAFADIEIQLLKFADPSCLLVGQGGQGTQNVKAGSLLAWSLAKSIPDKLDATLIPAGGANLYVLAQMREGKLGLLIFPLPSTPGQYQIQGIKDFASVPVEVK
jgi:hypothetical protein